MVIADTPDPTQSVDSLLARARAGSPEAFCTLGERCQARLYRQALGLCRNPQRAEELTAETLVEAWRSLARFDGTCQFPTWLYAILLRRHWKAARHGRLRPASPENAPDLGEGGSGGGTFTECAEGAPGPDRCLGLGERDAQLLAAVGSLPEKHRDVILLRFYEDASLAEIAGALGISLGTVKSRLFHALEKLRAHAGVVNLFNESRDV